MLIQPEEKEISLVKEGFKAKIRELTPADYLIVSEILGEKKDDAVLYENALVAMSIVSITTLINGVENVNEFKVTAVNSLTDLMKRQAMPIKDWNRIIMASAELNNPNPEQMGK